VQEVLGAAVMLASRQVLRVVDTDQPATLVFSCGEVSVLIEIHLG
jgi:hypothetical protein